MPSRPFRVTQTGLSTTAGYAPIFVPDTTISPFSVAISAQVNSTNVVFSVEHTMDYTGSSVFVSTAALWFQSSGITAATTNAFTHYTFPVTAIRLTSTAGSSAGTVAVTILQAG